MSDTISQRDEFDQELFMRPFSTDCRKFMQLMYSAANGASSDGIDGHFAVHPEPMYVMAVTCCQQAIALRCGIRNDAYVRRACRDLEEFGILRLKTNTMPNGKPETYYYLSLSRLLAIRTLT